MRWNNEAGSIEKLRARGQIYKRPYSNGGSSRVNLNSGRNPTISLLPIPWRPRTFAASINVLLCSETQGQGGEKEEEEEEEEEEGEVGDWGGE